MKRDGYVYKGSINGNKKKMKTPGVGNKKRQFKKLLGWGKKNERTKTQQNVGKRSKLSRKLRRRRTKRRSTKRS